MTEIRKIIHIDMDAFYASIEQRDHPAYRGKPLAVGGNKERGVVAAASYEAREYGVYSAMPSVTAYRKCPDIIFVRPRFDVYRDVSRQIRTIFKAYTDLLEPLALDEAFLDVTHSKVNIPSATLIAREIKKRIFAETRLTASAGISINKFLAKIASDQRKPDGLFVVKPEEALSFIEQLPIEKFFGIGKVTAKKMHALGISNGKDLKNYPEALLAKHFGKMGRFFYQIARGIDNRPVNPNPVRKSISAERTYEKDLTDMQDIFDRINELSEIVFSRLEKSGSPGRTLTLKIRFHDFKTLNRSKTHTTWITEANTVKDLAAQLITQIDRRPLKVRLLGLGISNLKTPEAEDPPQLSLEL